MTDKVSVIIPTYNRFQYVLNAIESIQYQTYPNVEIIVVNDKSTQEEYYTHPWGGDGVTIIHLPENTKSMFGFACAGYVRTVGMKAATGKYIAFCDDDDIWLPDKLTLQIEAMKNTGCQMSSTEGFYGNGVFSYNGLYKKYNSEYYYQTIRDIFHRANSRVLDNGYPQIWDYDMIKIHNCMVTSSVVVEKAVLEKVGYMQNIPMNADIPEDWDCWLRVLKHTKSVYVTEPCFYYDGGHGDGQLGK
jgi:glycosyltransferase involved in cell wall biosynthesis